MELHQLRYLLAVAQTGGFSKAAAKCHIAQPSLSQQIQKLEQELGVPLFDRLPRGAVLTDAGARLRTRAQHIIEAVNDAMREASDAPNAVAGRLTVGAIPTVAPYVLPTIIRRFARKYPQVELRIEENFTEHLVDGVADGRIDLALLALPIEREGLHAEPLMTEPLLVALPASHRLAKRKRIRWSDLNEERLIVLHEMHCLGKQIGDLCRRFRRGLDVGFVGSQLSTIQSMVTMGMGLSFMPAMTARKDATTKRVYLHLTDPQPTRTLAALSSLHRYRTNATRAMLAEWRNVLAPEEA